MPRNQVVVADNNNNASISGSFTAGSIIRSGGLATQFLMANGSVSTNPGWITGYTETDTLATVTARGASTSTTLSLARVITTGLYGPSTSGNIPIWQYDANNPGYGIVYFESSPDLLRIDVSGQALSGTPDFLIGPDYAQVNGNTVWHAGNFNPGSYLPLSGGTMTGNITMNAKIVIQNGTDGGGDRGIWMWTGGDSNWGIYMGTAGSGRSLANGTAPTGIDGSSSHHIRFRVAGGSGNGFVWENNSEQTLMSLKGDNGNLYTRGQIYAGNSTSNLVWHSGNLKVAYYENDTPTLVPVGPFDKLVWGTGSRAAALIINDVAGARYAITGGSYDLSFYKHNSDAGTAVRAFYIDGNGTAGVNNVTFDVPIVTTGVTINGNTAWHQGNLTNLNQLTNGPGYITSSALSSYLPLSGGTMTGALAINSTAQAFTNVTLRNTTSATAMPTQLFLYMEARYNSGANGTNIYHWIRDSWEYNITNNYSDITLGATGSGTTYVNLFRVSTDGQVYATNSFRAPIFYDSQNTNFYLDPAGTSNIGAININGVWSTTISTTGGWNKLSFVASNAWGDGTTYGVLGAGGGAEPGVMTYNQHATWVNSSNGAGVRMGRSGGVSSGTWYQVATMDSNEFMIAREGSWGNGGLKITSDGVLRYGNTGFRYVWESGTWGISISGNSATTSQTNFSSLTVNSNAVLHAANFSSYTIRWNSTSAYANGLNNTSVVPNSVTLFDGYGAAVPNYPAGFNQWWVGALTMGDASRGFQIAGGYADSELHFRKGSDGWQAWRRALTDANFSSFAVPLRGPSNWNDSTVIDDVIGLMAWKNYGNNHVIFDASQGTAPNGTSINNTNSQVAWTGSYPTLMGWNGSNTYGVRVDSARIADTLSNMNISQFTNNSGYLTSVGWASITAGTRTGYGDLRFQPPASSFAGIQFLDTSGNGAGWFLIRGTSDTDVYTAEGITLVADKGWLTLAQRESGSRGVRIMSGTTSTERLRVLTDGTIQFVNGAGFTYNGNTIWHAGNFTPGSYLPLSGGTMSGQLNAVSTAGGDHGLRVGAVRGQAVGSQGGDYIMLYERVHIGYPSGWGASQASAPTYGLGVWGNIHVSQSNATGGGIILADDGDIVDLNDAWCSMRFTSGVRIYSANRGGSAVISLGSNGVISANSDVRAPIFYDSQDTFYYVDPNSTSRVLRMQPVNLGGATLHLRSTDLHVESGSREAVTFIDGSQVQAHVSTGNGCGGCCYNWWSSEDVIVDPNKDYEFHVWVRSTGNDAVYLGWGEYDSGGGTITSNPYFHTGAINTGGTWVKLTAKLKNWRTAASGADSYGTDRYANTSNMSNDYTGTIDGVMHSFTRRVWIRLGTCYGSVNGSKTYFYGAQIREAGYDDYQQNFVIPYYNGSSWGGKLRFGLNDWGYFGIGMYGAAGEFRMSSDSGDLNLRVDGWIRSENYVSGPQVYASSGWFRNQTNNTGLYNENTTQHWSSKDNGYWDASSTTSVSSIRFWTGGHISSLRGYVYANTSNEIGFLNSGGSWSLRLTNGGDSYTTGNAYIGRHIDAQNTWGNCGCVTLFAGWNSSKVVLGNGNNGGHDYANNLGSNSVVSTNNFYCYLDITAYSDARVKDNVEIIEDPIKKVQAIRGVTFTRNDVEDKEKRHAGVIAQEVREVLPEVVSEDTNGHYSVAYGNLTSLLIEAIKEQQKQIDELKEQLKNK